MIEVGDVVRVVSVGDAYFGCLGDVVTEGYRRNSYFADPNALGVLFKPDQFAMPYAHDELQLVAKAAKPEGEPQTGCTEDEEEAHAYQVEKNLQALRDLPKTCLTATEAHFLATTPLRTASLEDILAEFDRRGLVCTVALKGTG